MTIKELEDKIVKVSGKPSDDSQFKSMIAKKGNEIANLKSQLKIPIVHPVQIVETRQLEKEKEPILTTKEKYTSWVEERDKNIKELTSQIDTRQFQIDNGA